MAEQLDLNHGYYYQFLNNPQKQCYDALLTHMRQFETKFSLDPVSQADYLIANRAVLDDHPELWWADTPARYNFNLAGNVISHNFLQLKGNEQQLSQMTRHTLSSPPQSYAFALGYYIYMTPNPVQTHSHWVPVAPPSWYQMLLSHISVPCQILTCEQDIKKYVFFLTSAT